MFCVACTGGAGDTTIDITHDPCSGITLLDAGASTSQRAGIAGALQLWAERGVALTGTDPTTIEILFEPASVAFRGVYDDERGIIHINDAIDEMSQLSIVIAHELGHAFGLEHVSNRPSVMNPANLTTIPTDDDRTAVEALWGQCEPLVGVPDELRAEGLRDLAN